jgi:hypothetical protein
MNLMFKLLVSDSRLAAYLGVLATLMSGGCAPSASPGPTIAVAGATDGILAAVTAAGGIPVALAPEERQLGDYDALILGPGLDLDPALYGEAPDPTVVLATPEREDHRTCF